MTKSLINHNRTACKCYSLKLYIYLTLSEQALEITGLENGGLCDVRASDCTRIRVFGLGFKESPNLHCEVTRLIVSNFPWARKVLMTQSNFDMLIFKPFTLNRAECHHLSLPQRGANTFKTHRQYVCYKRGELKRLSSFQDWFLGNAQLCIPANFLCGVLFNSCLVQLHCSPVKPEITVLFLILCIWNRYAWSFS